MKVSSILTILSLLFFLSCGDSNSDINPDNLLIGEWEAQSFEGTIDSTVEFEGQSITSTITIEGKDLDYGLTFDERNYTTSGDYRIEGNVMSGSENIAIDQTVSDISGNGTYTYVGDVLTSNGALFNFEVNGMSILQDQEEVSARVESLTEEELVLVQTGIESSSQTFNGVTTSSTNNIDFRSVWKRK